MYQVGLGLGGRRLVGSCDGAGSLEKTRVDAGSLLGLMSFSCRVEKQGHRFSSKRALVNYKLRNILDFHGFQARSLLM
jgi:hypothetical protein